MSAHVLVQPTTVACPGHGEHLRAQWPAGFALFSLTIIKAALEAARLRSAAGARPGHAPEVEAVNAILARRPACYFVDRATIRKALMAAEIATLGRCDMCSRPGLGGAYTIRLPTGDRELGHVCFECALDTGERIHAAQPDGGVW